MNKIICIIEDTGERRHPVEGEKWISDYSFAEGLKSGDVASSVYSSGIATHHYKPEQCMIVTETIVNTVPDPLNIKERCELINLRRFRDGVMQASNLYGRTAAVTDIALLQAEVRALSERLDTAGRDLYIASTLLDPPCTADPPKNSSSVCGRLGCAVCTPSPQDVADKQAQWAKQVAESDAKEAAWANMVSQPVEYVPIPCEGPDVAGAIGGLAGTGIPLAKFRDYGFSKDRIIIDPFKTEEEI